MKLYRGFFVVIFFMFTLASSIQVNAKLTVLPPEKMLSEATIIVTGEVTKIEEGTNSSEENFGIIEIDKILKGSIDNDILSLKEHYYKYDSLLQGIPPVGTKVFVLLKENENNKPYFFAYGNHIGIIKDGSIVEIYKGINLKIHPYAEKYNEYYQKYKANAKVPNNGLDENKSLKGKNELTTLKDNSKNSSGWNCTPVFVLIFFGLIIFTILFILVRRSKKDRCSIFKCDNYYFVFFIFCNAKSESLRTVPADSFYNLVSQ